jgi:ribose-phosphate pyrophosphokinase
LTPLLAIGLIGKDAIDLINSLPIERLVVTNTTPQLQNAELTHGKLTILDVSPTIAESIRRTHNGESFSILFGENEVSS